MIEAIGAILPLAIAVTISPLPIIGEILLLFSKKPVANAGAYLAGFVLGITVVLGVLVTAADAAGLGSAESSTSSSGVQVAAGVLLLVGAFRRFRSRPGQGEEPPEPRWTRRGPWRGRMPTLPCVARQRRSPRAFRSTRWSSWATLGRHSASWLKSGTRTPWCSAPAGWGRSDAPFSARSAPTSRPMHRAPW